MTVGSLFSGIGGFDLGLERAGFTIKWQVENDLYCTRVLAKHWPHVKRYGDIRTVDWGTVSRVDLLCGGFPCQDLSFAGKRAGIDGDRSGLWTEYLRAIRALRPRFVLVENVPGLLTNAYMGRVLGDLAASGYDAEWDCLPASSFGAPHRRDRVWIMAYPDSISAQTGCERYGGIRTEEGCSRPANQHCSSSKDVADAESIGMRWGSNRRSERNKSNRIIGGGQDVADADINGLEEGPDNSVLRMETNNARNAGYFRTSDLPPNEWWITEPDVGRVAHGVPHRVDRLRGLGNAIVPQIAEWLGRRIMEAL